MNQPTKLEFHPAEDSHNHGHDFGEKLYIHRHTLIHSLSPHLKILLTFTFVFFCISTPNASLIALLGYAIVLVVLLVVSKLPLRIIAKRSLIEVPFLIFAVLMPFFGKGETVDFLGVTLYKAGLIAGLAIICKGTLGVYCALILSATTKARELVAGLERLKLPSIMVQIAIFMLRYINVISDEMDRMKIARESRGFEARGIRDWKVLSQAASALFIRSYERGERVHLAMVSRGYLGHFPQSNLRRATRNEKIAITLFLLLLISVKVWEITFL